VQRQDLIDDRLLSTRRLAQLEDRWRNMGAPIVDHLQPGLSDKVMDELTAPLGLRLPHEARVWWGWHNGVPADAVRRHDQRTVGVTWPYLPLAEAVELCAGWRTLSDEFEGYGEPRWFDPRWLPITSEYPEAILVCDCGTEPSEPSPIRRITPPEGQSPPTPVCASFDELVTRWIEALDCGVWQRQPERWSYHPERLPEGWPLNGVA
jgi:hypothetical protein